MTAAYRLKGIGWFAGCTTIVLGFYLVSLQVATERKNLERLNGDIAATQRDIRALETEFDTRANLAQLERWNGDTLALSAPQPSQFLHGEAELASLEVVHGAPAAPGVKLAALIVPSFVAPATPSPVPAPVTVAAVRVARPPVQALSAPADAVAGRTSHPLRVALARIAARLPSARPSLTRVALEPDAERPTLRPAVAIRARPQVALLDRKLLSDSTLRDLIGGARAEGGKLR